MKTWEMFKELAENPKKKFKSIHENKLVAPTFAVVEGGGIMFKNSFDESTALYYIGFDWIWKEVKQPVSFMEAVKSRKRFKVEHELLKDLFEYTKPNNIFALSSFIDALDEYFTGKNIRKILTEGKFYIED